MLTAMKIYAEPPDTSLPSGRFCVDGGRERYRGRNFHLAATDIGNRTSPHPPRGRTWKAYNIGCFEEEVNKLQASNIRCQHGIQY